MVCAGLLVLAVFPAAYVELPTDQLLSKSPQHQLRVYTAGVRHRLIIKTIMKTITIGVAQCGAGLGCLAPSPGHAYSAPPPLCHRSDNELICSSNITFSIDHFQGLG